MRRKHKRKPWILRLPKGVQYNPAWIFIGSLFALAGIGVLAGVTAENPITDRLAPFLRQLWGLLLFVCGTLLILVTIRPDVLLERLILRILSIVFAMYGGWAMVAIGPRAIITVLLCLVLVCIFEIRLAVIKQMLSPWQPPVMEGSDVNVR